jgi:hypothetical protein
MSVQALRKSLLPASFVGRRRRLAVTRDFRARGKLTLVAVEAERCALCQGAIDRFDRDAFIASGRCAACQGDLELF